jgi:RNA polymerase sigma factor (sigma-70 family)
MANGQLQTVIGQLRRLVGKRNGCTLADAQLLHNFVARHDEPSFEVLVWRHGAMVLRVCQRVLHHCHDSEDAFQATFLTLARKAGSIGKGEAVGSWLYKVAYRIALRLRARNARRRSPVIKFDSDVPDHGTTATSLDELPAPEDVDRAVWDDLGPVLDQEINRLPEKYRVPFVLCYLEGQTNDEAAAQLGCPRGTVLSRLARGRERLRSRLSRRGIALSSAGLVTALSQCAASAAVPAALVTGTTGAALAFAAGNTTSGLFSASVASLTQGVLRAMFLTKVKIAAAALLTLTALTIGVGSWPHWAQAENAGTDEIVVDLNAARGGRTEVAGDKKGPPAGKVIDVAKDGKGFTIEIPSRDEEAKKLFIKVNDKTSIIYVGVGPNGAKPTEGYRATVKLAENSADVAAGVTFHGPEGARHHDADLIGKLVSVAKDGKSITMEGAAPTKRDEEPKKIEVQFNDKTQLLFSGVTKGGAKLAEGCKVRVHLLHGAKENVAAIAEFMGTETVESRDGPAADATGKIVAMAQDGKAITIETAPESRDDPPNPAKKVDIKIGDKTIIVYQQVGLDGTKLAVGLKARAWLADGSKDTAAKISLTAVPPQRWVEVSGKVVGIANNGSTFSIVLAGKSREEEAKKLDIKLTIDTRISYSGVGPDEAKLAEGYQAHVWLADGSTDTAYRVIFTKPGTGGGR